MVIVGYNKESFQKEGVPLVEFLYLAFSDSHAR